MTDYRTLAVDLVSALEQRGADEADILILESRSLSIEVRLGQIEKLQEAGSKGLGIRVFKDHRTALTYTSDFSDQSVSSLLDDTLRLSHATSPDPCNGLPPSDRLGVYDGEMALYDEAIDRMPMERKLEIAQEVEAVGMAYDPAITNSIGGWWMDSAARVTLANSHGFVGSYPLTSCGFGVTLVAERNGVKQRDFWYSYHRFLDRLEPVQGVGEAAARRTLRKLGPRKPKTQTVPVVFDPQTAADLLRILFEAASGSSIYRKSSFLIDKIGSQIGSPLLTIRDCATLANGLGSRPFDAEGVKASETDIIQHGVLRSYLCDTYSARKLQRTPTGNAARTFSSAPSIGPTNLYIVPGTQSPDEIIGSIKQGLYVTSLYWVGVDQVTGNYSRGAEGLWIENGELSYPVQEITIAGNVLEMLTDIAAIGNDLVFRGPVASPTFLVSKMVVSGR